MRDGRIVHRGTSPQLIATMEEGVWKCFVDKSEVAHMMSRYKISNMKSESHGAWLRVISGTQPLPGAVREEATLEDLFLYYFGEKAGEHDGAL